MSIIKIQSPAKINLFLYVNNRLDNGYHELFTLMACVNLYDEIELTFNQPETTVVCNKKNVPQDESNIAFKAVALFNNYLALKQCSENSLNNSSFFDNTTCSKGVKILIKKEIPVGAGLGGGSSNAASVLKALNQFYGSPFSIPKLMEMGLRLGADVPFFILGSIAIAEGVGEKLSPILINDSANLYINDNVDQHQLFDHSLDNKGYIAQKLGDKNLYDNVTYIVKHVILNRHILLFYPGFSSSTAQVYKNLDLALTKTVKSNKNCLKKSSAISDSVNIKELMHNNLEFTACSLYPDIEFFRKELIEYLPESDILPQKIMMTGSGSTFFTLFSDYEKAKLCYNELSSKWKQSEKEVFLTSLYI